MPEPQIRFDDGAAYEDFMGKWSRLAGDAFLRWLAPPRPAGAGSTSAAATAPSPSCWSSAARPAQVQGIDPSAAQLAFARPRLAPGRRGSEVGDAMALPYADAGFDAAVMALVIFFVPDPAEGGGRDGARRPARRQRLRLRLGHPRRRLSVRTSLQEEMAALGPAPIWPPSVEASRMDTLRSLWSGAGLVRIETLEISVERTFDDFDMFWRIAQTGPRLLPRIAAMSPAERQQLQDRLRARLLPDASGRITCSARANAIRGEVAQK